MLEYLLAARQIAAGQLTDNTWVNQDGVLLEKSL